jgi:glutaminyl-tRNA synthetase
MIGIAKANSAVDIGKLEFCIREDLNQTAPRVMGVLRPVEVELVGWSGGTELIEAPLFPPDVGKPGSRPVAFSDRVLIDREDWSDDPPADFKRLGPGRTVRLRYGYCITATDVIARDASGAVTKLRATVHLETKGGKNLADGSKPSGVIHWVDAASSLPVEMRLYDRLFKVASPEEGGGDFLEHIDPKSLEIVTGARVEASLASASIGSRFQLERVGYFVIDQDSKPGAIVMNRTITLRDAREKEKPKSIALDDAQAAVKNPKAQSRPKGKSPAEFRAEARLRDPELAAAHTAIAALDGITEDQADLLTGDLHTASLFRTVAMSAPAELAAKWMINELPRALGDRGVETVNAEELGKLLAAVHAGSLAPTAGKAVLAELVRTGRPFSELAGAAAAPAVDLGAAVDAVIAANPEKAAQYRAGKTGLLGFFVGQVMKASPNADAAAVNAAVRERLV